MGLYSDRRSRGLRPNCRGLCRTRQYEAVVKHTLLLRLPAYACLAENSVQTHSHRIVFILSLCAASSRDKPLHSRIDNTILPGVNRDDYHVFLLEAFSPPSAWGNAHQSSWHSAPIAQQQAAMARNTEPPTLLSLSETYEKPSLSSFQPLWQTLDSHQSACKTAPGSQSSFTSKAHTNTRLCEASHGLRHRNRTSFNRQQPQYSEPVLSFAPAAR